MSNTSAHPPADRSGHLPGPGDGRPPRIAIAGGGLGGLVCARVLERHGLPVTVLERESSPTARTQGGSLDIHPESGQEALRACGLFEQFSALARPEGQEYRLLDRTGAMVQHLVPEDGAEPRPEIDRGRLRDLLLGSLAAGTVRWGAAVETVTPLGGGTSRVTLADGRTEDFDLVIGADGAWSRVRAAVTGVQPWYTGVTFVESYVEDCDRRHPDLARLVGPGSLMAKEGGQALFAQRNGDGRIRVYAAFRAPEDWHAGLDLTDPGAVREYLLARYADWDESLLALVRSGDGGYISRPLHALPVPHTWESVPGLTLLGDAAHLMPPLGVGANLAMQDGLELARALVTEASLEDAVRAYERVMLPRAAETAAACAEGLAHLLPPTGETALHFPEMPGMRTV
ncbi:FAD-dependent monooxygenase [Streptomyces sp. RS10V-4]|uniref:FAD-dependent oxidoreductase n=1 Tax=Streptomyces rhizoryzae TaxID=2932493 RepID=UPI002004DEE3|nr:NAD(P)/FAD-dependent oxidoreductase [Streptomyces rhizoryzae]MCK7625218.1 FAD-dependent monooxygenase [Streptomyces rhizoryzae]